MLLLIAWKNLMIFSFTLLADLFIGSRIWLIDQPYQSWKALNTNGLFFVISILSNSPMFLDVGTYLEAGLGLGVCFDVGVGLGVVIRSCNRFLDIFWQSFLFLVFTISINSIVVNFAFFYKHLQKIYVFLNIAYSHQELFNK